MRARQFKGTQGLLYQRRTQWSDPRSLSFRTIHESDQSRASTTGMPPASVRVHMRVRVRPTGDHVLGRPGPACVQPFKRLQAGPQPRRSTTSLATKGVGLGYFFTTVAMERIVCARPPSHDHRSVRRRLAQRHAVHGTANMVHTSA